MQQIGGLARYHFADVDLFYSGLGVHTHRGPLSPELEVIQFLGADKRRGYGIGYH